MKNINYEALKGDEHVCKSWSLMPFKIDDNYEYISKNTIFNFFSTIILIPIAIILFFFNKIFLGFEIEGKENKIKDSGFVSVSNHIHYLDCTFIGLINYPNRVYYPTIQENFKIPFVRHLIKLLCAIPIPKERKHKDKFYKQINEALEKNNILHMYPEGSLWPYYENIRDFKYGAFKIAVEANKPIQPIRFVFVNPDGIQKLYKRKKCIHAIILPAIYPDEALEYKERIEDLRNKTYDAICKGGN